MLGISRSRTRMRLEAPNPSCRISIGEARCGDFVLFRGSGLPFRPLSLLLSTLEPSWRKLAWKPWHVAVIVDRDGDRCLIFEGRWPRSQTTEVELEQEDCRVYRWFPSSPDRWQLEGFLRGHLGRKYDIVVYGLTILSYVVRRLGFDFPRVIDKSLTCWEAGWDFASYCGRPLGDDYEYPFILDLLRVFGEGG